LLFFFLLQALLLFFIFWILFFKVTLNLHSIRYNNLNFINSFLRVDLDFTWGQLLTLIFWFLLFMWFKSILRCQLQNWCFLLISRSRFLWFLFFNRSLMFSNILFFDLVCLEY
jgi:hypothetical protein